ncbi:DUF2846 domain-containing protein [Kangiella koreensis]|uniref:DUF2846 domain-containing protein n=1 Tax=Kangiella koreensis (strain DSM 16069 / JCM 12317 / KCTC 12182 / SW-125) TaxID=523791 RepID=C7R5S1_KANKD|nr:DUF2846 domain-containing protein [Kangiella koreensis]ACV27245.1 conserved hypothetical protein [Kangiella koreensis DSM 16069]
MEFVIRFLRTVFFVGLIALTGCAASGPAFQQQTATEVNQGTVYFYRVYSALGSAASPYIYIDGKYKGKLKTGGYLYFHLPEGNYEVTLGSLDGPDSNWNWAPAPYAFDLRMVAGEPKFYKMIMLSGGDGATIEVVGNMVVPVKGATAAVTLEEVESTQALVEIKKTKLSN